MSVSSLVKALEEIFGSGIYSSFFSFFLSFFNKTVTSDDVYISGGQVN